ncbi:MAG: ISL3 family transposase [Chloroflexota bacterium]|nr:ISL3 family transposase [Chloroflexota bacterium]
MNVDNLLVGTDRWRMASLAVELDGSVMMSVVPRAVSAICPVCGTPSSRRHTWYRRTALDLPWRKFTVRLRVWARRFFCDEPACPRKIFAERFTGLLPRYGRRTVDATGLLLAFAQRAGGEAGARLARAAGLPTSPDTLRRLLRNQEFSVTEAPAELGVDDFALHRRPLGYGLLLVDLAVRRPIDVLPDDESATLATWLREHPGARLVARDRGLRIRDGVKLGAPNAIQVADRFHLLRNVVDALDQLQRQRRAAGSTAFGHGVRAPPVATPDPLPPPDPTPESKPGERQRSFRAGPDQWERARALRAQGWAVQAIGREISLSPKTVRRLLNRATPPSQEYVRHRHVPRLVEPFIHYLLQRWADGCRNGRQLTREIEQLGYLGKGSAVRWMIARWRPPKTRGQRKRRLLTRHVPWLLLRTPALLKEEERADLERVLAADACLDAGCKLVQRFRTALHDLDVTAFKQWLLDAAGSDLKPFARLAAGMTDDLEAITNAFRYPWSTGPVEGHITRVKLIKRAGYGRAKLPLLRARILGPN